jgi:glycosyltransferase involved in cell wall biosynthesis
MNITRSKSINPNIDTRSTGTNPLVSIMMPAYNAEKFIGEAIESVLRQSYQNWELIIVDDGSLDRTGEIACSYQDPRIKLLKQQNKGESPARNAALQVMNGKYTAFLDADDVFRPSHLELCIGYLEQHPEHDAVYTDGFYCNQEGKIFKTLSSERRGPFEGWIFPELVRSSDVFGPPICVVIKRNLITKTGILFDPDIVIGPDWDFMTRISETASFGYIDKPTCLYRVHNTNVTLRTHSEERALSLAKCREKAISLEKFNACRPEVRTHAFYDLLVNLLSGSPFKQNEISQLPQFELLPKKEQARLLRLIASKAIIRGGNHFHVEEWLERSRKINPQDKLGVLIASGFKFSPFLCRTVLNTKQLGRTNTKPSIFGDLKY